jgi:glutamine synthetase type III
MQSLMYWENTLSNLKKSFWGDGYSEEWEVENAVLSNFKTTPEALKAKISKQSLDLFSELKHHESCRSGGTRMKLN